MAERPTLESVAAHARVSRQTVSNAINAPHLLHPETLLRVREAISQVQYRPRSAARSLRTRRSQLVGVGLRPSGAGGGYVLDRFLRGLAESAEQAGYHVMLFTAPDDQGEIAAYDELLATHDLDAFVLTSTHHGDLRTDWLADRGLPFVTFGRPWGATARHSWVDVDGASGTRSVTRRLLSDGHRRIAFVGWPAGSGVGDDRVAGWRQAVLEHGADPDPDLVVRREDGVAGGRDAVGELWTLSSPPTAFVCASDSLALGAFHALSLAGRAPGRGLPVVGFDDTPVAAALQLTSIAQPLGEAAAQCVRLLLDVLDPDPALPPAPTHVLLEPQLVVRATGGDDLPAGARSPAGVRPAPPTARAPTDGGRPGGAAPVPPAHRPC